MWTCFLVVSSALLWPDRCLPLQWEEALHSQAHVKVYNNRTAHLRRRECLEADTVVGQPDQAGGARAVAKTRGVQSRR